MFIKPQKNWFLFIISKPWFNGICYSFWYSLVFHNLSSKNLAFQMDESCTLGLNFIFVNSFLWNISCINRNVQKISIGVSNYMSKNRVKLGKVSPISVSKCLGIYAKPHISAFRGVQFFHSSTDSKMVDFQSLEWNLLNKMYVFLLFKPSRISIFEPLVLMLMIGSSDLAFKTK